MSRNKTAQMISELSTEEIIKNIKYKQQLVDQLTARDFQFDKYKLLDVGIKQIEKEL